ncbi:NAD(P)-dependent oxidoreductase [Pantoea phytobeneficialis]|uniref:NAD(P)-dependent oxidoreductase n=1 Tax=Pantoea phytobeneficialis TaxID=2052056 RepID=A0AAP9HAF5_9GAMM|nr:NAD(P)-dependent oxidoreductase [Pantoea phytobeneficialis]MDO6406629.1 NAD(P)-dependent oxidoreductase [Pantoea phytobeneficialis]QGR09720.1 hypothetical protein CTZ24_24990 [Pantoea phytobeneficialis]
MAVWNRTPAAVKELASAGAIIGKTPREAVASADVVLSMVRDDDVSHEVWLDAEHGALAGMQPHSIAIESSTLTPGWIKTLAAEMATHTRHFVEAPVSGSRPQAEAGTLVWFAGGEQDVIKKIQPVLLQMGSVVYHTGAHGSAALTKLATNALMGVQVTAIAEIIGILNQEGADVARVLNAVSGTSCWSPLAGGIPASYRRRTGRGQYVRCGKAVSLKEEEALRNNFAVTIAVGQPTLHGGKICG